MKNPNTYTLAELAEAFGLTERTARYWIEKILPPHHKKGRGKLARYGQDTWNCFAFIQLANERHGLRPGQVAEVLAEVPQETVDRVVAGEEELKVMAVPTDEPYMRSMRRASDRARRYLAEDDWASESADYSPSYLDELFAESAPMRLRHAHQRVDFPVKPGTTAWRTVHADKRVRIDCLISKELTPKQEEKIRLAAKLIWLVLK